MPNFKQIFQGDTPTFRFEFKSSDGSALPEGIAAVFVIASKCGAEVFRNENLLDGTGKADFRISKSISDAMEPGEYRWGISLKYNTESTSNADYQTLAGNEKLFVSANITKPGADGAVNTAFSGGEYKMFTFTVNPYQTTSGGTSDYNSLENLPSVNNTVIKGDLTSQQLGLLDSTSLDAVIKKTDIVDPANNPNGWMLLWAQVTGNAVGVQIVAMGYSPTLNQFKQTSLSIQVASTTVAGIVLPEFIRQVQKNRDDIENLLQTGTLPLDFNTRADLSAYDPVAEGVKVGQDTTVLADEEQNGSVTKWVYDPNYDPALYPNATVVNGFRFRFIGQEVPYTISTATTLGLILSTGNKVPGKGYVEEDGTLSIWGWDDITDAIADLQAAIVGPAGGDLSGNYPNPVLSEQTMNRIKEQAKNFMVYDNIADAQSDTSGNPAFGTVTEVSIQ